MAIFRERSRLSPHYIPGRMLHRDREQQFLRTILLGCLENLPNTYPAIIQILGGVGAGKTTLSMKAGRWLEEEGVRRKLRIKHVYINLRGLSGSRVAAYRHIVRSVGEELYSPSLSVEELLTNMLNYLRRSNTYLFLTFDEVDQYVIQTENTSLIYDFTRIPELAGGSPTNIMGVIFISREGGFRRSLDRPELSSLGLQILRLEPYRKPQVFDILSDRVAEAFVTGAVSDEVIDFISEKAASPPMNGDIRYGLDLLMYAGNLAESLGRNHISFADVRKVVAGIHQLIASDVMSQLGEDEKIVLLAVSRLLRISEKSYALLADVRRMCGVVSEEVGRRGVQNLVKVVKSLESRGLVRMRSMEAIDLGDVDPQALERYLENVMGGT